MNRNLTLSTLSVALLIALWASPASGQIIQPAPGEQQHNHDSIVVGSTVHAFAGDAGSIDPFFGYGVRWDTFSDFQGVEGLEGNTIWEFIALGMQVYYFQSLTNFSAELPGNEGTTLEFDANAFQLGILATLMYLPGAVHPYVGFGFTWTELWAEDEDKFPGREIFPMMDFNVGSRLDLNDIVFLDLSLYGNIGRNSNIGLEDTRTVLFFSTFLGVGINVL